MTRIMLGEDVPVAVTDLSPFRLELVERMGGVPIDVSSGELADQLAEREIAAPDVAFDSSGRTGARMSALDALAKRGVLVCVGHGGKAPIEVRRQLIEPERAVLGSEYFRYDEMAGNLALLHAHHDYLSQIITHRFSVDRLQEAFELFLAGQTAKVAIER